MSNGILRTGGLNGRPFHWLVLVFVFVLAFVFVFVFCFVLLPDVEPRRDALERDGEPVLEAMS